MKTANLNLCKTDVVNLKLVSFEISDVWESSLEDAIM